MAYAEHSDFGLLGNESVERDIPGATERDHQFAQVRGEISADEGMGGEHLDPRTDGCGSIERRCRVLVDQETEQPLEVVERLSGIDYLRQGLGRPGLRPLASWSSQRCTSVAAYASPLASICASAC